MTNSFQVVSRSKSSVDRENVRCLELPLGARKGPLGASVVRLRAWRSLTTPWRPLDDPLTTPWRPPGGPEEEGGGGKPPRGIWSNTPA